jgi:hypothetical protein
MDGITMLRGCSY